MAHSILITGGAGFIGTNFVYYWMNKYPQDRIVVLDVLTYAGSKDNLSVLLQHNKNITFIHGNICNQELVETILTTHHIDHIVHFAAESHVDRSISGPDAFIETNIIGTYTLLKAALNIWTTRNIIDTALFHHVSTDEVYGSLSPADPAFSETTAYAPNSPYSASKASSDHLVRAFHHTYGLRVTTSNCSNNYGPYQFPEKLIPLAMTNALHGKPIPIYGDGKNIRDWLYVDDHCRGIELVMSNGRVGETYNIGGENEMTNIDLIHHLCAIMDELFAHDATLKQRFPLCPVSQGKSIKTLITYVTDRAGHDRRYAIDPTKCKQELGYAPRETFETAFRKTLEWYLNNESWWQEKKK
jgi:dTDP-glucose 4,6-dehydratase